MSVVLAYITNPNKKTAQKIARYLLKRKLIACANIFPIGSLYTWKGKIINDKEHVLIAKTTARNFDKLKREVEKIHPYQIPCIIKLQATANKKFLSWVEKEVKK